LKTGLALALFGVTVPAFSQYAGPAILSRGEAPTGLVAPEVRFTPYVGVSAVWDSGLANVSVNSQGTLATSHGVGASLTWGISGTHSWRRTKLGLSYGGGIDHYFGSSFYDSLNQNFFLGVTHQATRRSTFAIHTAAGIFNRLYTPVGLSQTVPFDPTSTYVPTTDFFDNRTVYVSGSADWAYRKTARLSFDFGGNGAIVRRRSAALYGTVGYGAHADVQYRTGPHSTVGAEYAYFRYDFTRVFGGSDVQQIALTYNLRITPKTEFGGYGGAAVVESKFVAQVPLDPAIAALLGIPSATYVSYTRNWQPAFSVRLSRVFARGVAYVAAVHEITPGNGFFLTSTSEAFTGGYDYSGTWKRWSIGTYTNYQQAKALGGIRAHYATESAGVSISRRLFRYTQYVMGFSIRNYSSKDYGAYNRTVYSAHAGLGFSPGEVPLRLW
jgi:hypothetical protein